MNVKTHIVQFVQLAAIAIILFSCYQVLRLFIPAILFAVVVCLSTWPLYLHLCRLLQGKSTLAATPWPYQNRKYGTVSRC